MTFEWDESKAAENEKKHDGVTFREAAETFLDANAVEDYDDEHSDISEIRFVRIGNSSKRLLRVSYTVRADETDDEIIRIISARKGKSKEEKIYYEQNR
ncbi:MAG TPA: BrnT family toxin [Pyrinomonadaceae bacterium]|nr:BrnT family toxin [Pyrinomonadaceae bacterium]